MQIKKIRILRIFLIVSLLWSGVALAAFSPFVVKDIRVEGLQRIAVGTVFNYLPVKKGETLDEETSSAAVRALYKTGFFRDVYLERDGNTLIVFVVERPSIASVKVKGNNTLPKDQVDENLKRVGIVEGRIFNRSLLDGMEQDLRRAYLNLGRYNVRIKTVVTPEERNRVDVKILIDEGKVARIQDVKLLGVTAFNTSDLLDRMESGVTSPIALFSSRDKYSRQKLSGDLENLRSYYMDRGYIDFHINSTQVSITPDKHQVYITVNIHEGKQFSVADVEISGKTIVPEKELRKLIDIRPGDVFSRRKVIDANQAISDRLGELGYAFANVNPVPEINRDARKVKLTFYVDPGERAYVRRINITGNSKTEDKVIRREMRQQEDAWFNSAKVKRSKVRLDRLGFFTNVDLQTPPVPGAPDQVDLDVKVNERDAFGSLNMGIGYGDTQGFLVNASVSQDNFLGTGNRFSIDFNNSQVNTVYSFDYFDPYYTQNGVSRDISLAYRKTDSSAANISNYTSDSFSGGMVYGVPISEHDSMHYNVQYENTLLHTDSTTATQIMDFCNDVASSGNCRYDIYRLAPSWSHDTRNATLFPSSGSLVTLGAEVSLPLSGNTATYYKFNYSHKIYTPLDKADKISLLTHWEFDYGKAYGNDKYIPPYERYYAGGVHTVRGYRANSLGPLDSTGTAFGGSVRTLGSVELLFPFPGEKNSDSMRLSAFVDGGNVYNSVHDVSASSMRYSAGVMLSWFTPVGPLGFSLATPLNAKTGDHTEQFQFTLGTAF